MYFLKQYLISSKQWNLPDGTFAPKPKEDGQGDMLSSFVSRDFGYSFDLSPKQLTTVNSYRQQNNNYLGEDAAKSLLGINEKYYLIYILSFVGWNIAKIMNCT